MSVFAILIPVVIAFIAAGLRSLVLGAWAWRSFVADFVFALAILLLPGFIHA
jgi:hypothetical protein